MKKMIKDSNGFKHHETAEISNEAEIGKDTLLWNNSQVREGASIGSSCNIGKNCYIDKGAKIGNNVKIQNNVSVWDGVTIEDNVMVGPSAVFTNDLYPRSHIWNEEKKGKILVERGASIGANATVICGKRIIGRYAMIGAGSVVTKNVPDFGLVVGNPAILIGYVCECGKKLKEGERCDICKVLLKKNKIYENTSKE